MQEFVDVGVLRVERDEHRAASAVLADDFARRVEDLEEGYSARRAARDVVHAAVLGAQAADVHADAAAVGEDLGDLLVDGEDGLDVVRRRRHDVAVR